MLVLSSNEIEQRLVQWVRSWLDLLAAGKLDEACASLDEPCSGGVRWTPENLVSTVEDTYGPGGALFSTVGTAKGTPHYTVSERDDASGYWVDHDIPLDGEWSDLTAQFEFRRQNESLSVRLYDIHVM
jgi:hypothetical protein